MGFVYAVLVAFAIIFATTVIVVRYFDETERVLDRYFSWAERMFGKSD